MVESGRYGAFLFSRVSGGKGELTCQDLSPFIGHSGTGASGKVRLEKGYRSVGRLRSIMRE